MIILLIFIVLIILIAFIVSAIATVKLLKKNANAVETTVGVLYIFSLTLFVIGMMTHTNPYYKAIDAIDMGCYNPFSDKEAITLVFYFLAFNISLLLLWIKGNILPPLTLTLSLIFILLGVLLSVAILFQVSVHNTETLDTYSNDGQNLFLFAPLLSIALGVYFIYKATIQEINETFERKYSNKILNYLNNFLATKSRNPFWIFLLMFPVFFMVTLILILFGQDSNSIIKVFTDTATWKLSQQTHPPILEHTTGHYLCTVAAAGHPKIVKPIRFGQRNGKTIIVNRQLLIANAFEELIQDVSPKAHYFIRTCYDKYGYNLSKKINTVALSNTTYILMKPLEWVFLICLYLFCNKPEQKINHQYTALN